MYTNVVSLYCTPKTDTCVKYHINKFLKASKCAMLTVQFMPGNLVYYKIPDSQDCKDTYNWKKILKTLLLIKIFVLNITRCLFPNIYECMSIHTHTLAI